MNSFYVAASVFIFLFNLAWLWNNKRWVACTKRAEGLEDYAGKLSGWDTRIKVKNVALGNFWRRCEYVSGLSPELGELWVKLVGELSGFDTGGEKDE